MEARRTTHPKTSRQPARSCGRRHLDAVGLAIAIVLSVGSRAQAHTVQFSVNTARVETDSAGGSVGTLLTDGGVNQLNGASGDGHVFTNDTDTNSLPAGGSNHVVSVGSSLMSVYGFQADGGAPALYNGFPVVMVFALEGTASGIPTTFSASGGRVALFTTSSLSSYERRDPRTWGATNAAGTALLTPIAVWDLATPADIVDLGIGVPAYGGPGTFTTPAARVNKLVTKINNDSQGRSLFRETQEPTFADTPGALSGNNFITVIGNPPLPSSIWEGIAMETHAPLATSTHFPIPLASDRFIDPANGGAAGFAALNTIAAALGGLPDLGGPGTAFATGYDWNNSGGPGTSFNPTGPNNPPNTDDRFSTFEFFMSPGQLVAHERLR